jgi:hypothetical protein
MATEGRPRRLRDLPNWERYLFFEHGGLDEEVVCIHCQKSYKRGESAVWGPYVYCPVAECDGTLIDQWEVGQGVEVDGKHSVEELREQWPNLRPAAASELVWRDGKC